MRIVFWGSSDFSLPSLEALRENFDVVGVVTNEDKKIGRGLKETHMTPMKFCAMQNDMSCMQPASMKDENFHKELLSLDCDLFVIVSFGRIIPESLIYMPKYDSINLHASLLPKYRGASPIQNALLNGEKVTGNSVQFITKELDRGDVIAQSRVEIEDNDNYSSLIDKLAADGANLLIEAVKSIEAGTFTREKQDDSLATYVSIIKKDDGVIDFDKDSAEYIRNKSRAYSSWPGIHAMCTNPKNCDINTKVIFTDIRVNKELTGIPGTILRANKQGFTIACAKDAIDILKLRPAGKKEMDYKSYINGYKPVVGSHI